MPSYSIEARSFRVAFACCHNFWVIRDAEREVTLAELHGLAYDRVRRIILPIGTNRQHALRVFVFPHDAQYAATLGLRVGSTRMYARSRAHRVYGGSDGLARWSAAVAALPLLDGLDIDYPPYGFNLLRPTMNSNAAYRTFGEIMDVPVHRFSGVLAPGGGQRLLTREEIDRLRYRPERESAAA